MKTKNVIFLMAGLLFTLLQVSAQDKHPKTEKPQKGYCSDCFYKLYDVGERYGNTILQRTPKGNFIKYNCLSNGKAVFSCGRDSIEYKLDTTECKYLTRHEEVQYEDDDIMVLHQGCGTYCWVNTFVFLHGTRAPIRAQAYYIDTTGGLVSRYISLLKNKDNVYFQVHSLHSELEYDVRSNYYKFIQGGVPEMHISDVYVKGNTIFYTIEDNGKAIKDSVEYKYK